MSEEIKIDKGIPIPPRTGRGNGKGYTAALRKLEIGDSCVLPVPSSTVCGIATPLFGTGGYCSRKVDGGIRVWRLK